jgi:hypothetical protein
MTAIRKLSIRPLVLTDKTGQHPAIRHFRITGGWPTGD